MTTKLSERSYAFAQEQIRKGRVVLDQRTDWSEHQPSTRQENEFIETHGWDEYASWHLGLDDEEPEQTKARYKFPYGDFARVHRLRGPFRGGAGRAVQAPGHRGCGHPAARDVGRAD